MGKYVLMPVTGAQFANLALLSSPTQSLSIPQPSSSSHSGCATDADGESVISSPDTTSSIFAQAFARMTLGSPTVQVPAQLSVDVALANNPEPMSTASSSSCTTNYWKIIPFELRNQIFGELAMLKTEKKEPYFKPVVPGKLPALLVAFEFMPSVREEAFMYFRESNGDSYHLKGYNWFEDMNKAELETIRYVELDIHLSDRLKPDKSIHRPYEQPSQYAKHFDGMPNIIEVKLKLSYFDLRIMQLAERFVCEFPFWLKAFKNLHKLEVEIPKLEVVTDAQTKYHNLIQRQMSAAFELGEVFESFGDRSSISRVKKWRWEVLDGGKPMDWSTADVGFLWYSPLEWLFNANRDKFPGDRNKRYDYDYDS